MALGANLDPDFLFCGLRFKRVATGTYHGTFRVIWMYFFFHLDDSSISPEL